MSMASTAHFLDSMETVQRNIHEWAKGKGFWDEGEQTLHGVECSTTGGSDDLIIKTRPINVAEKLMLIVSEVAEAMEEDRNPPPKDMLGKPFEKHQIQFWSEDGGVYRETTQNDDGTGDRFKPCGFAVEMADIVIRVMDLCEYFGIDLGRCILAKMGYNRTRPRKHGKNY